MFFILVLVMVFSNYEISYSQYTGNFYFLDGTEGNEKAIMYLHITDYSAYGYYYTESKSIEFFQYSEGFDGKNLNLEYSYYDYSIKKRIEGTIKGTLSGNIVFIGEHNSKSVNLSLANMPVNSARLEENYDENYYSNYADSNYGDIKFIFNIFLSHISYISYKQISRNIFTYRINNINPKSNYIPSEIRNFFLFFLNKQKIKPRLLIFILFIFR